MGAGASLALTGGLAASTAAVTSAAGSLASSAAGGLVAAGTSVANKASSAANNVVNALSKSKIAELGKSAVQKVVNSFKGNNAKAYRYVSESELNAIKKSGKIPNTNISGELKNVFVSPNKYYTVSSAERNLQIGNQNPLGATTSPLYRVEFNMSAVKYNYGGNVMGEKELN